MTIMYWVYIAFFAVMGILQHIAAAQDDEDKYIHAFFTSLFYGFVLLGVIGWAER